MTTEPDDARKMQEALPWWQRWDGHGGTTWLVAFWSPRRLVFLAHRVRMRWLTWRGY